MKYIKCWNLRNCRYLYKTAPFCSETTAQLCYKSSFSEVIRTSPNERVIFPNSQDERQPRSQGLFPSLKPGKILVPIALFSSLSRRDEKRAVGMRMGKRPRERSWTNEAIWVSQFLDLLNEFLRAKTMLSYLSTCMFADILRDFSSR